MHNTCGSCDATHTCLSTLVRLYSHIGRPPTGSSPHWKSQKRSNMWTLEVVSSAEQHDLAMLQPLHYGSAFLWSTLRLLQCWILVLEQSEKLKFKMQPLLGSALDRGVLRDSCVWLCKQSENLRRVCLLRLWSSHDSPRLQNKQKSCEGPRSRKKCLV